MNADILRNCASLPRSSRRVKCPANASVHTAFCAALAISATVFAAPSHAQTEHNFTQAYTAFIQVCLQSAPTFAGVERAARGLGIQQFRSREESAGTMNYGYNYDVADDLVGRSIPRDPQQLAVSYVVDGRQVDNLCVLTFSSDFPGSTGQLKEMFFQSVRAQMAAYAQETAPGDILRVDVGGRGDFDYEFSYASSGSTIYLNLNVWD